MKLVKFMFAAALLSFVSCNDISEKFSSQKNETEVTEDENEPDLYLEDEQLEDEAETTDTAENETIKDTVVSETTAEVLNDVKTETLTPGKFYIIAGSFKDYKKAENLYKELTDKGYSETQILDPVNNFSRVVIKSYNNENLARAEMAKLRKQYNDESIWLLPAK